MARERKPSGALLHLGIEGLDTLLLDRTPSTQPLYCHADADADAATPTLACQERRRHPVPVPSRRLRHSNGGATARGLIPRVCPSKDPAAGAGAQGQAKGPARCCGLRVGVATARLATSFIFPHAFPMKKKSHCTLFRMVRLQQA